MSNADVISDHDCCCWIAEPVSSSAFLCDFSDLSIKACLLDDVFAEPDQPEKDAVCWFISVYVIVRA